jgi:hypothetical protein
LSVLKEQISFKGVFADLLEQKSGEKLQARTLNNLYLENWIRTIRNAETSKSWFLTRLYSH